MAGVCGVAAVTICFMDGHYSTPMKRTLLGLALFAVTAHAQTWVWDKWDPMAVRSNRTADVVLELQTAGTVSAVRLDYANGGSITQMQTVPGRWPAAPPPGAHRTTPICVST